MMHSSSIASRQCDQKARQLYVHGPFQLETIQSASAKSLELEKKNTSNRFKLKSFKNKNK